jgi:hypothetical protein
MTENPDWYLVNGILRPHNEEDKKPLGFIAILEAREEQNDQQ